MTAGIRAISRRPTASQRYFKWRIIITTLMLVSCHTSHVLAIRKGRLMSPSTFTALSGDLHVQIQFSGGLDVVPNALGTVQDIPTTTTTKSTTTSGDRGGGGATQPGEILENVISSTLVISKYVDDDDYAGEGEGDGTADDVHATLDNGSTTTTTTTAYSSTTTTKQQTLQRKRKEIVRNIPLFPDPRNNVTQIAVPCQTFKEGGLYEMQVVTNLKTTSVVAAGDGGEGAFFATTTSSSSGASSGTGSDSGSRAGSGSTADFSSGSNTGASSGSSSGSSSSFNSGSSSGSSFGSSSGTSSGSSFGSSFGSSSGSSSSSATSFGTNSGLSYGSGSGASSSSTARPTVTTTSLIPSSDERLRQTLDVRWPSAEMLVQPDRLHTYPEEPVHVELRFPQVNCQRATDDPKDLPEFWLELIYCGRERRCGTGVLTATPGAANISKANILYAEQIVGFPKLKVIHLGCELFGLAGNYAVQLRPMLATARNVPITRRFLSVDWSDRFIFNVYARSIFPCDPHTGIGVLYEYPTCILEQGDRVRVYAKLRADVASLKPPTTLHYVAEQRVVKSQYSLYFGCDLFSEKYVEYCFVYVSQAISGAVADVRMDCVPTLPVSDSDTGGWGPWSEWTPCSTNCLGGTRNRYRFCDSPPPRYGAKFCEGASVETEKCGKSITDTWDCIYETSGSPKTNRTEVSQEIGPGCRCGCIVHLGSSKPKRVMAGATQSCPGRSFWLIQVDGMQQIRLTLNFLRLPCPTQYVKIRDGPSLSSTLLSEMKGGGGGGHLMNTTATTLESTGAQLLLEFYAGDEVEESEAAANASASLCTGGFLANAELIVRNATGGQKTLLAGLSFRSRAVMQKPKLRNGFTVVHLSAIVFASIIILISALLGAQYVVRYRKYHIAIAKRRDEGSRLHTPHASMASLHSHTNPPSRALSTTTLISEVFYLVKLRPKHQLRHSILRESVDAEALARRETEFNSSTQLHNGTDDDEMCCAGSVDSIVTLRNEIRGSVIEEGSSLSRSPSVEHTEETGAEASTSPPSAAKLPQTAADATDILSNADGVSSRSGTLTRKDSAKDSESIISSGMSSLCHSPQPPSTHRLSKYSDRYDAATLKLRNSRFEALSSLEGDSLRSLALSHHSSGGGNGRCHSVNLTQGCYSPAASVVSTATIRTTNAKESKEKQNRRRLLARPGSEFSLGQQEELELDYYDYNVINAGAAPGSYLGMDPAHLIWIPPFDDDDDGAAADTKTPEPRQDIEEEPDETVPLYEEIRMPKYGHYLSPGSNTDTSSSASARLANSSLSSSASPTGTSEELSPLSSSHASKVTTPQDSNRQLKQGIMECLGGARGSKQPKSKSSQSLGKKRGGEAISMQDLGGHKSERNIALLGGGGATSGAGSSETADESKDLAEESTALMTGSYVEKETTVEKATVDPQPSSYLDELDDIQFADDSESDYEKAPAVRAPHDSSGYKPIAAKEDNKMSSHHRKATRGFVVTHI